MNINETLNTWQDTVKNWQKANQFAPMPVPESPMVNYHQLYGRQKALVDAFIRQLNNKK